MDFPINKTKIVCTIGPASSDLDVILKLIQAGMNVARLNFSHGDFASHAGVIRNLKEAARLSNKYVTIMADLPGPKMRIGLVQNEPVDLYDDDELILTTEIIEGDQQRVSVNFARLPEVVSTGDTLSINDGLIQLRVVDVRSPEVVCKVVVGGELRSRKGLNFPGINLGTSAFTEYDQRVLQFAAEQQLEAVSQSFVSTPRDIEEVKAAAAKLNYTPFIIAKIERATALDCIDAILDVSDGVMVARGDLGVEIPIEKIAIVQKELIYRARKKGKPVITATHMLESMVAYRRPTRAEATDVANAILDGTDCVMLSGESAMGKYPIEATQMLAKIAAETEPHLSSGRLEQTLKKTRRTDNISAIDLIALGVQRTLESIEPTAIVVPTRSGETARNICRFHLDSWVIAFSPRLSTCHELQFSYGVIAFYTGREYGDWNEFVKKWLHEQGMNSGIALLTQGPSPQNPEANHKIEIIELDAP